MNLLSYEVMIEVGDYDFNPRLRCYEGLFKWWKKDGWMLKNFGNVDSNAL